MAGPGNRKAAAGRARTRRRFHLGEHTTQRHRWRQKPDRGAVLRLTRTFGGSPLGGADALLFLATLEGPAANDNGAAHGHAVGLRLRARR